MGERYWTTRAEQLHAQVSQAADGLGGGMLESYLWSAGAEALTARDPEMLSALLRVGDGRSGEAAEVRFGLAVRAMQRRYYDCAFAAWDDGGRCWASGGGGNVPDSAAAAEAMRDACDQLLAAGAEAERALCAGLRRKASLQ